MYIVTVFDTEIGRKFSQKQIKNIALKQTLGCSKYLRAAFFVLRN